MNGGSIFQIYKLIIIIMNFFASNDLKYQSKLKIIEANKQKIRVIDNLHLKQLNDSQSNYSSLASQSMRSSLKNLGRSSFLDSSQSILASIDLKKSRTGSLNKISNQKSNKTQTVNQVLEKNSHKPIVKQLITFLNHKWLQEEKQLLADKKFQSFLNIVVHKTNALNQLTQDLILSDWETLGPDLKVITSLIFRQVGKTMRQMEGVIGEIIKKIPEEKVLQQEGQIEELSKKLLEIYDPRYCFSSTKMKERFALYHDQYVIKRNNLRAAICTKLKSTLDFVGEVQNYFGSYQRQVIKLKAQLNSLETEKNNYQQLLNRKISFTPIQINYQRIADLKAKAVEEMRNDLNTNIVQFHQQKHHKNQKIIQKIQNQSQQLKLTLESKIDQIAMLQGKIDDWKAKIPKKKDFQTQVFLIPTKNFSQNSDSSNDWMSIFLQNVVTPFTFNTSVTASLINILTIDKILYDYDLIKNKLSFRSFKVFIFEWFIVRTGCKKIAQIFIKNFLFSLKQLRNKHKRYTIFNRICGFSGYRKKNMQQDLQNLFFQTNLCWYYLIRLSLMYRLKLNNNPTGYHIFPPLDCEEIFKIPLRKTYQIVQEFLTLEGFQIPKDINQRVDIYCINEISKYKSLDQNFQKQTLEEIHILREINFDLIAGFLLEYIAVEKCSVVQKLFRTIHNKQRQEKTILSYSQFEAIYRRYFRQKRAKIEMIYSKLCLVNQFEMLDIQNLQSVVLAIIEDETPLRTAFDQLESFKILILSQKAVLMKNDKKILNPNSFENFRQRYYHEFYDFYSTTTFLEEIFRIIRGLIKKKLKRISKNEEDIDKMVELKTYEIYHAEQEMKKESESDDQSQKQQVNENSNQDKHSQDAQSRKDFLVSKLEEWNKIIARVPHFSAKVLTIDQIVIHNMRRKQMIDASEFAWRTLREILSVLGKN